MRFEGKTEGMARCRGRLGKRRMGARGEEGLEGEMGGCWESEGVDHSVLLSTLIMRIEDGSPERLMSPSTRKQPRMRLATASIEHTRSIYIKLFPYCWYTPVYPAGRRTLEISSTYIFTFYSTQVEGFPFPSCCSPTTGSSNPTSWRIKEAIIRRRRRSLILSRGQ